MKIYLTGADEWYPVYDFYEPGHWAYDHQEDGGLRKPVEIDARIVKRWVKARAEFEKMQRELQELTDRREREEYERRNPGKEFIG